MPDRERRRGVWAISGFCWCASTGWVRQVVKLDKTNMIWQMATGGNAALSTVHKAPIASLPAGLIAAPIGPMARIQKVAGANSREVRIDLLPVRFELRREEARVSTRCVKSMRRRMEPRLRATETSIRCSTSEHGVYNVYYCTVEAEEKVPFEVNARADSGTVIVICRAMTSSSMTERWWAVR